MADRSTSEVFNDHLARGAAGDVDGDVATNYAPDVVLLTGIGVLRGHDGVRRSREALGMDLPNGRFTYVTRLTDGENAFLEWTGESDHTVVLDGADGFVIRDGLITAQTIHYTITHRMGTGVTLQHTPAPQDE